MQNLIILQKYKKWSPLEQKSPCGRFSLIKITVVRVLTKKWKLVLCERAITVQHVYHGEWQLCCTKITDMTDICKMINFWCKVCRWYLLNFATPAETDIVDCKTSSPLLIPISDHCALLVLVVHQFPFPLFTSYQRIMAALSNWFIH